MDLGQAAERSREMMDDELRSLCASEVPGDTHRNLNVSAQYAARTFKHVLLPIWLLSYTYGSKNFQVIINGWTGEIAGKRPYSWVKILLAILAALAAAGLFALLVNK